MATFVPLVESSDVPTTVFVTEMTPNVTDDVLPVPPFVEEAVTLLVFVPEVTAVIVTVTVQLELTAIDAPLKLTLGPLAAAVTVPLVQVVEAAGVPAFCIPAG